jgi:transcriptional regulator with XRE-family HTH domain
MSRVSQLLSKELKKYNLSRQALSRAAGVSDSIVTKVMNDNVKLSVDNCIRIALALSISIEGLFDARVADERDDLEFKSKQTYDDVTRLA